MERAVHRAVLDGEGVLERAAQEAVGIGAGLPIPRAIPPKEPPQRPVLLRRRQFLLCAPHSYLARGSGGQSRRRLGARLRGGSTGLGYDRVPET